MTHSILRRPGSAALLARYNKALDWIGDFLDRFLRWAEYPNVRDCIYDETLTLKVRRARLRDLLGMPKRPTSGPEIQGNSR